MIHESADSALQTNTDWEQAFDAISDPIAIIDLDHTVTRANKAMAARWGLPPEELVGRKCYEVVHGSSRAHADCPHARMMQIGRGCTQQIEEPGLKGIFDISVSPLFDTGGRLTASAHVVREVTEDKRTEEAHKLPETGYQHGEGVESIQKLRRFVHDFNNILTVILGHCIMIKEGINVGMSDREHLQEIEDAGIRAAELCRQMVNRTQKSAT